MTKLLTSEEARQYLADKHDVHRSPDTFHRWHRKKILVADGFDGIKRRYHPDSLDAHAARITKISPVPSGIPLEEKPMTKDLTSRTFKNAGAEATEKRRNVEFGKGGRNRDVGEQNADTQRQGRTGHQTNQRGAGAAFTEGGPAVPGKRSSIGISAPARSGRTGNVDGEAANRSRGPRRDKTRDYGK
jgi:hypothetical protein